MLKGSDPKYTMWMDEKGNVILKLIFRSTWNPACVK
jgi:hypothetical protein